MKKKNWYLFLLFIGFLLIITGIFTLDEAITEKDTFKIWIRSLLVVCWVGFTISNYFLFRKETRKSKESEN